MILAPVVHLFSKPADSIELGKGPLWIYAHADFKSMDSSLFVWQKGAVVLGTGKTSISLSPKRPGMDTVSLFYNDFVFKFGFKVTAKVVDAAKLQKVMEGGISGIQSLLSTGKRKEASERKNALVKEVGGGQLLILYTNGCPEDTCRSMDEFYQILKMGAPAVKSVVVKPVPNSKSVFTVKID